MSEMTSGLVERASEVSIITPGGWVVLRQFWLSRSKAWIGTVVINWRSWTVGVEWLGNGALLVVGPVLFAVAAVQRKNEEPTP